MLRGEGFNVWNMATTGIASILLPGGRTAHSSFALDVPLRSDSESRINTHSTAAKLLKQVHVFILDEAPMTLKYGLECISNKMKEIMKNNLPFGGKIMLLGGDFRQCLPIQKNANRSEKIDLSIKSSYLWKQFKVHKLTINERVRSNTNIEEKQEQEEFAQMVLDVSYFI